MEIQFTVKGLLELARMYYTVAENVKGIAEMKGGSYWKPYWDARESAGRCVLKACELLGEFDMLPEDVKDRWMPF